jgi:hypothetical protein
VASSPVKKKKQSVPSGVWLQLAVARPLAWPPPPPPSSRPDSPSLATRPISPLRVVLQSGVFCFSHFEIS